MAAAVQISNIAGTQYSGAYDKGGTIPAGSYGIAGERGPEIIQGPASVVSRKETAALLRGEGRGQQQPSEVNIRVLPVFDQSTLEDMLTSSDAMERVVVHHITRNRRRLGL